jgi:hypothetical protein
MHRSRVLEDNPWQDPAEREVAVYLPHGYAEAGSPRIALWDLAAFTNSGPGHLNWRNQGENLPARLDRLIGEGGMEPVVVVIPDCYTSLGGNQYVNSAGVGRYADYLVEELVRFSPPLQPGAGTRGLRAVGKSSGGYGALTMPCTIRKPGVRPAMPPTWVSTCCSGPNFNGLLGARGMRWRSRGLPARVLAQQPAVGA